MGKMKISNEIIKLGEYIYRVYQYKDIKHLELGNAYTFGSKPHESYGTLRYIYVLPYRGIYKESSSSEVGIYLNKDTDNIKIIHPITQNDKVLYSIERIKEITPDNINTELSQYLKEIDPNELKYSGNVFIPPIHKNDDIGVKAIKLAISAKQINFNAYKNRFAKPYEVSNTRKALMTSPTLTFTMLMKWCEIFDLDFSLIFYDSRDSKDPMFKNSNGYNAIMVSNSDPYPVADPSIKLVNSLADVLPYEPAQYENEDNDEYE